MFRLIVGGEVAPNEIFHDEVFTETVPCAKQPVKLTKAELYGAWYGHEIDIYISRCTACRLPTPSSCASDAWRD
jgi:hypothetical protein